MVKLVGEYPFRPMDPKGTLVSRCTPRLEAPKSIDATCCFGKKRFLPQVCPAELEIESDAQNPDPSLE